MQKELEKHLVKAPEELLRSRKGLWAGGGALLGLGLRSRADVLL